MVENQLQFSHSLTDPHTTAWLDCALVSWLIGEVSPKQRCELDPIHVKALLVLKHSIAEQEGSALGCGRLHQSTFEGTLS